MDHGSGLGKVIMEPKKTLDGTNVVMIEYFNMTATNKYTIRLVG